MKPIVVVYDILICPSLFEKGPRAHTANLLAGGVVFQAIDIKLEHFLGHRLLLARASEFKLLIEGLGTELPPLGVLVVQPLIHRIHVDVHQRIVQRNTLHLGNILRQMRYLDRYYVLFVYTHCILKSLQRHIILLFPTIHQKWLITHILPLILNRSASSTPTRENRLVIADELRINQQLKSAIHLIGEFLTVCRIQYYNGHYV